MKTDLGLMLPGGKTGVLLLHDVSGSAPELKRYATALARRGYTVACPQLIGLGDAKDGKGSAGMLVSEAEQALSRLRARCDSIVVIGMAFGAMLGLELARHNAASIQAVVLVEPKAWLPSLPFAMPAGFSGRIKQVWLAKLAGLTAKLASPAAPASTVGLMGASTPSAALGPMTLQAIGKLLDSVHSGLPSVLQPVLLVHRPGSVRAGRDGSFLLQRRLGGRVESVMVEDSRADGSLSDRGAEVLVERADRFVSSVLEEIAQRRENELRRRKVAEARSSAA